MTASSSNDNRYLNPEWIQRLMQAFPLPVPKDDECRDQFLQNIFASFTPPMMNTPSDSSSSSLEVFSNIPSKGVTFRSLMVFEGMDIEGKIIIEQSRSSIGTSLSMSNKSLDDTVPNINLKKVMRSQRDNVAQLLSVLAILYALHRLRSIIYTLRSMWHPHVSYDKSLRMFSWSLKDYYARFNQKNVVYCDTFVTEVGDQMECVKYRTDLAEVIRLLDILIEDVERMRNICDRSMKAIKEAQTDVFDLLTETQKAAQEEYKSIMLDTMRPMSLNTRHRHTINLNSFHFIDPIEARYKINWTQTKLDQAVMFDRRKCEEMMKELAWLKAETNKNHISWQSSQLAYDFQIDDLKRRIANMEFMYEEEMLNMELKIDSTKVKLSKVKDDLQFYKDQLPKFREKIARTRNILSQRESQEHVLNKSVTSVSRLSVSTKSANAVPRKKGNTKKTIKKK